VRSHQTKQLESINKTPENESINGITVNAFPLNYLKLYIEKICSLLHINIYEYTFEM